MGGRSTFSPKSRVSSLETGRLVGLSNRLTPGRSEEQVILQWLELTHCYFRDILIC